MFEISYFECFFAITVIWIVVRAIVAVKNKKISWKREALLLLVFTCIAVIARFVNFPLRHVDGHIGTMKFDSSKIFPLWLNVIPIVHLFDVYDGWIINIIGNTAMFIPVGIVWPICFKKLDTIPKAIAAGAGFSLFIEIVQLFFYERCSDIDDLILNSIGATIGVLIVFAVRKVKEKTKKK